MPKIDVASFEYTYASITINITPTSGGAAGGGGGAGRGDTEYDARTISYGDSVSRSLTRGAHQVARGMTSGDYDTDETNLELYLSDFHRLQKALGNKFYETRFKITVAYAREGSQAVQDELVGCAFTKRPVNHSQGSDGLTVTVGVKPAYIKFNGQDPFSTMPTVSNGKNA